ncbi:MAG: DUF1587 domain-containing protein, partial [Bdellovibrionia bacterium]
MSALTATRRLALIVAGFAALSSCSFRSMLNFTDAETIQQDQPVPPPEVGAAQIRLLNSREYKNSVKTILGVDVTPEFEFGARGTGFDTAADGKLSGGLMSALLDEGQRLAEDYVENRLAADFQCAYNGGD